MSIHHLIVTWGYAAVFVLVAVESLGLPLPGETTLVAAATYAGAEHRLSVWLIFVVAVAAVVGGNAVGFWIGDAGGYRLVYRYGRYIRFDEPKVKVARYLFDRHGGIVVLVARFIVVLRTYAAFLAGTSQMRFRRFLVFTVVGALAWAGLYSFLPFYASSFLSRASTTFDVAVAVAAVAVLVAVVVFVRRHLSSLVAAAEAAYPGPLDQPRHHHPGGGNVAP